jgi:hypothetical protein
MTRNQRILLAGLILAALILIFPTIGHCTAPTCQQLAQVTLAGNLGGANGLPASNYIMTLTPSQQGFIAGCQVNLATTNTCATSTDGSVVGLPNPLTATINTTSGSGSLGFGVYYTVYEWYDAAGHLTVPSPETATTLSATGSLVVNPPVSGIPALAAGMDVFIGTASGGETLQGQTTGTSSFVQAISLASGASPASSNTTLCQVTANDAVWPTGTGYSVTMVDQYGNPVPNYPMQWQLMGAGSTINLSNGLPYYHGVVYYPVPILSAPANHGVQSISGPLNLGGYNLTGVGKLGVGTSTPGWGVDVEGAGLNSYINAKGGYLVNGGAGTTGQALCSDGTYLDQFCTFITSVSTLYYQTVAANGTAKTQRPVLNFSPYFTVTDSSSPAESTVAPVTTGTEAQLVTAVAAGTSGKCPTWDASGGLSAGVTCPSSTAVDQFATVSGCAFANDGGGIQCSATGTFGTAFADTSYVLVCALYSSLAQTNSGAVPAIMFQPVITSTTAFTLYEETQNGSSTGWGVSNTYGVTITCHGHHN